MGQGYPHSLHRSLSVTVYPSNQNHPTSLDMVLGPCAKSTKHQELKGSSSQGFFKLNSKLLKPPASTVGAAALSLHYSNLIIVLENMTRSLQLIGFDARDDLYPMLPQVFYGP